MKNRCLFLQLNMVDYNEAWELQKALLAARMANTAEDSLVLLQHPPTFTFGRRYKESNLISNKDFYKNKGFAVYKTDRGGLATYHGPGQLVGYPILKMNSYTKDYYYYLRMLEEVMIRTLSDYEIKAVRNEGYTGVWVDKAKIGFIGVRIALGYTMHGFSLNVNNDVSPFNFIIPCGIQDIEITSVKKLLSTNIAIDEVQRTLVNHFEDVFQVRIIPEEMASVIQRMSHLENLSQKTIHPLV
ncbi:MAG TPA: lipoyl(octanoyl) transferase LipB [Candidatus Brocadiaceae bacterium]